MTVSTSYAPLSFNGDDATTAFAVTWPFFDSSLVVTLVDSTGVETVKTITTHYTVSGGTDSDGLPATGTVTMLTAPASGETLRITRNTSKVQSSSWTNGGAYQAKTLEATLDKIILIAQETQAGINDDITGDVMQLNTSGATDYWDAEDQIIRNVPDPVDDDDAANRGWVQSQLSASTIGDSGFTQSGTGAVERTWQSKMRDAVSVLDFIPVALHSAIADGSNTTSLGVYIQAALDAHKRVWFPTGDYLIDSQTLTPSSGARLYGPGRLKKTISAAGYTSDFIEIDGVSDVQVIGLAFYEPTGREYGVRIEGSSNIVVEGCKFNEPGTGNGVGTTAVYVHKNVSNVRIVNNSIFGGQQGIGTGGDKTGNIDGLVSNILISGNYITNCDEEAIDINWHTHRCLIVGNRCIGNNTDNAVGNEEIDVGGSTDGTGTICRDIVVADNTILCNSTNASGVRIKSWSAAVSVINNVINQGAANTENVSGIFVSICTGCTVSGNRINGFRYGVGFASGATDISLSNNYMTGMQLTGIECTGGTHTGIIIDGNTVDGGDAATSFGIQLDQVSKSSVVGNIIRGFPSEDAIVAESTCSNILIDGNDCAECDTGIFCLAPDSTVSNNRCYENETYGIRVQAARVTLSGNRVTNNVQAAGTEYGIWISSADDLVMVGNAIVDTQGSPTQRGVQFATSCAKCVVIGNSVYPYLTTAWSNIGNLDTDSIFQDNYFGQTLDWQTVATDAAFTLTPYSSPATTYHTGTLTADRAITLATTNVRRGTRFRVVRTGSGAFNLSVGGLVNLVQNTWAEVEYDGSAYRLVNYGLLSTTVPVASGGTGATTARAAAQNLGVGYVLAQSGAAASHTGDTSETALATVTIPANAMGPNGHIVVLSMWSNNSSGNNKQMRVRFGGAGGTAYYQITQTTNTLHQVFTAISNRNSASSQVGNAANWLGFGSAATSAVTSSVDTTSSVDVVLSVQLADGADTATLERYAVYLYYGA